MEPTELIQKYNITTIYQDGETKIRLQPTHKLNQAELELIKTNKPAILAEFEARKAKETEDAKHIHEIILAGWEAVTIRVDDRKDINQTINEVFEVHGGFTGCSREDISEQIQKALNLDVQDTELIEAEAIIAKAETQARIPTWEEEKETRKAYNDVMNEGGDGYVPERVTVEEVQWAKNIIASRKE